mgnify:CR=1 FL=1
MFLAPASTERNLGSGQEWQMRVASARQSLVSAGLEPEMFSLAWVKKYWLFLGILGIGAFILLSKK